MTRVTLSTAVVYYGGGEGDLEHKSFAVISDDLSHDKKSVYAFNKAILEEVRKITPVTKVHYWSDGAASQFKNRYKLANILFLWLSNFVIDRYLELVKQASATTEMEVITWEKLKKGLEHSLPNKF